MRAGDLYTRRNIQTVWWAAEDVERSIVAFAAAAQQLQAQLSRAQSTGKTSLQAFRQARAMRLAITSCLASYAARAGSDAQLWVPAVALLTVVHMSSCLPLVFGQEERELREELAAKEALLQACTERLADWQARCERLAAEHRAASAL